jgi:hypothetical protein
MTDNQEIDIPETWNETDKETVEQTEAWIQDGHPGACAERLAAVSAHGELRYQTARSMFLAHAVREHGAGLDDLGPALEERYLYGDSAEFLREAVREQASRFVDEILEDWGSFSGSSARMSSAGVVMHALTVPSEEAGPVESINQLAEGSEASFAWVHEIVTDLASRGWVDTHDGVEVTDPVKVFEWWADNRTEPEAKTFHVPDPGRTAEEFLNEMGIDHAVTTYYAEDALQGHLYPRRLDTYVREDELARAQEAVVELGGSLGGTNFRLLTGDDSVIDEAVVGPGSREILYAPLPQVIVDLINEGGSAREAADLLIERAYPDA